MAAILNNSHVFEPVRTKCPVCHGFGAPAALQPACLACGAQWVVARFDWWIEGHDRGGAVRWGRWVLPGWLARVTMFVSFIVPRGRDRYRWDRLPCGHDLARCLTYDERPCTACRGVGTVTHWRLSEMVQRSHRRSSRPIQPRYPPIVPMSTPKLAHPRDNRNARGDSHSVRDGQNGRWWDR